VAAGSGLICEGELLASGLKGTEEFIDISPAGAYGAKEDDLAGSLLRSIGHGDEISMHIQTDEKCVILSHA
jgi:hypothetical protein